MGSLGGNFRNFYSNTPRSPLERFLTNKEKTILKFNIKGFIPTLNLGKDIKSSVKRWYITEYQNAASAKACMNRRGMWASGQWYRPMTYNISNELHASIVYSAHQIGNFNCCMIFLCRRHRLMSVCIGQAISSNGRQQQTSHVHISRGMCTNSRRQLSWLADIF